MYQGPTILFSFRSLNLLEHWEKDIIIMPILMMKKLRPRNSQLDVVEPGGSPVSSDPKVQALSHVPLGWPCTSLLYNRAPVLSLSPNVLSGPQILREPKPCLAGVYYLN